MKFLALITYCLICFLGKLSAQKKTLPSTKPDLRRGLILYYNADNQAKDVSSSALHGNLLQGAAVQEGRCGFASFAFDGEDDYIETPSSPIFQNLYNGLTISAWIHPKSLSFVGLAMIAGRWAFDNKKDQFALFINAEGKAVFVVASQGTDEEGIFSRTNLILNEWTHVVGTWTPDGTLNLYINGKLDNTAKQHGKGFNRISDVTFKVGRQVIGRNRPFKGFLDDIRLYSRALNAEEVSQLYKMEFDICNQIILEGHVLSTKGNTPVNGADVVAENLDTGEEVARMNTQESNQFKLKLSVGGEYALYAVKENYLSLNENIQTENLQPFSVVRRNLYLVPLEVGEKLRLNNIFFDFDKATLRPRSQYELNRLVKLFERYPKLKIEVAGHTDSKGSDDYNKRLSQQRADAVKAYLVNKKISSSKVVAKGYGEAQPVATNDTEEGRQLNRRVEIVILEK
ncbi:MAG: OmpA family protein [Cytophagales bacterium]|nr:OmpA family protein [Cytophagales bacterium]MDW8383440.1 LamG-like jellyroll fold domain-containing protein [Flammeovirgaceae bacterium]